MLLFQVIDLHYNLGTPNKLEKRQFIIGTSGWGSHISFNKSLDIGKKLISIGFNSFDTAPNYGAGYSHQIINKLSEDQQLEVDTKYGDEFTFSTREILKRVYRFRDIETFSNSFKYLKIKRSNRKYLWFI